MEMVGIAEIAVHTRTTINTELADRAVPGQADNVTGRTLRRIAIAGIAHIFPASGEILVRRFLRLS